MLYPHWLKCPQAKGVGHKSSCRTGTHQTLGSNFHTRVRVRPEHRLAHRQYAGRVFWSWICKSPTALLYQHLYSGGNLRGVFSPPRRPICQVPWPCRSVKRRAYQPRKTRSHTQNNIQHRTRIFFDPSWYPAMPSHRRLVWIGQKTTSTSPQILLVWLRCFERH